MCLYHVDEFRCRHRRTMRYEICRLREEESRHCRRTTEVRRVFSLCGRCLNIKLERRAGRLHGTRDHMYECVRAIEGHRRLWEGVQEGLTQYKAQLAELVEAYQRAIDRHLNSYALIADVIEQQGDRYLTWKAAGALRSLQSLLRYILPDHWATPKDLPRSRRTRCRDFYDAFAEPLLQRRIIPDGDGADLHAPEFAMRAPDASSFDRASGSGSTGDLGSDDDDDDDLSDIDRHGEHESDSSYNSEDDRF